MGVELFGVGVAVEPCRQRTTQIGGGGGGGDGEEFVFVGWGGEAGEGSDFAVGDGAGLERVRDRRQCLEFAADADPLAGGAGFDVGGGGEPVRRGW